MRKFYIENEDRKRKELQTATLFFNAPQGLGYGDSIDYFETEYGFYAETNRSYNQPNITGQMVFLKDHYKEYREFVDWISNAGELKLVYKPATGRELFMDVDIESIDLSEIAAHGALETPISFKGKSPYHYRDPLVFTFQNQEKSIMRFPFQFGFDFVQSAEGGSHRIDVKGHFPAALEMTIRGPVSNPVLIAEDAETGEEYGKMELIGVSINEKEVIEYSSRPNKTGIWKKINNDSEESNPFSKSTMVVDLLDKLDLANNNFFCLPVNRPVTVKFFVNSGDKNLVHDLFLYEYFRG